MEKLPRKKIDEEKKKNVILQTLLGGPLGGKLHPIYDGRVWEFTTDASNNDDSIFFSAAKILRLIYNCDLENKIDQDIWNLVKKGVQEEPTKIVADFDTFSYSTQKINPADNLLHIFNDT